MKRSSHEAKEEYWKDHVVRYRKSGQSLKQYCLTEELSYWTFREWLKKLEMAVDSKLVKISRYENEQTNNHQSYLEIIVSKKISIRVVQGFNGELLRDVLNELGIQLLNLTGRILRYLLSQARQICGNIFNHLQFTYPKK